MPDVPNPPNSSQENTSAADLFLQMMQQAAQQAEEKARQRRQNADQNLAGLQEIPFADMERTASPVPDQLDDQPTIPDAIAPQDLLTEPQVLTDHSNPVNQPIADDVPEAEPSAHETASARLVPSVIDRFFSNLDTDDPEETSPDPHETRSIVKTPHPSVPVYPAPPEEAERAEKLRQERVRRLQRKAAERQQRRVGAFGGLLRTLFVTIFSAVLASTIFTWFTNPRFIQPEVASGLYAAESTQRAGRGVPAATPTLPPSTPRWMQQIGIVSGHRGPENDPGAVCEDGLTEAEINFAVAQLVVEQLRGQGYDVDLLDEFDARLQNYRAAALVSIHANTCQDFGAPTSGYLVAKAAARPPGGVDDLLAECIGLYYGAATRLERRFTLTVDMTNYHTFREIHATTPAAILELGFMRDDRALLTEQQDLLASAIVNGVNCFLRGENPLAQQTPDPQT